MLHPNCISKSKICHQCVTAEGNTHSKIDLFILIVTTGFNTRFTGIDYIDFFTEIRLFDGCIKI